jgi:hypothetical protein
MGGRDSDMATLTAVNVGGKATLRFGGGANTVFVQNNSRIDRGLLVATNGGSDTVNVTSTFVGGGANIRLGDGDNFATWQNVIVGRNLAVRGGSDQDTWSFTNLGVGRNATFAMGDGQNDVHLLASAPPAVSSVGGKLSISGGSGEDDVMVNQLEVARDLKVDLGNGPSDTDIDDATILGRFLYRAGSGLDELDLLSSWVARNATINSGAGADALNLMTTEFAAAFTCNSGTENDYLEFAGCAFGARTTVLTGAGDDTFYLRSDSRVHGPLTIRASTGNDEIDIFDVLIAGRFLADTGDGNDLVSIARVGASEVTFDRAAVVRTGAGDDTLAIGTLVVTEFAHFRGPAVFDGGPGADALDRGVGGIYGNTYALGLTETNWAVIG